ncbi:MAG: hypothetical protein KBT36_14855 [Kurthia sp.]|nr:hypothetical protein [Candidatus Kurthia equi]
MIKKYSLKNNGNTYISQHFQVKEFASPDSDDIYIDDKTISFLEKLFEYIPEISYIIVSSGYRTPGYSISIGGYSNDYHTKGMAVDFCAFNKNNQPIGWKIITTTCQSLGINGIGKIDDNYVHIDSREYSTRWWGDEQSGAIIGNWFDYSGLTTKYEKGWTKDEKGFYYSPDGITYYKNCWVVINKHWYYFNKEGYAVDGLQKIDGKYYFFAIKGKWICSCMRTDENGILKEWIVEE